jgi:hypothetical protein
MKKIFAVLMVLALAVVLVMPVAVPALAQPTPNGSTQISFSANPATLSGDSATDVTITTTTTSSAGQPYIDEGKVIIELATDGSGNPVPAASVVLWVALNDPGQIPVNGNTTLDLDIDGLGFIDGMIGGFRAHYVTGGGKTKVDTHFSAPVDLEAIAMCEWTGETAWADGLRYVTKGNWATYTPYVPGNIVNLYAGQTMEAGTVEFSAAVDGYLEITITLNNGWRFYDAEENVKIQDYESAPSGNPSPGLFAHKFYADENPFTVSVPANNFYGVHVDVEWESCQ